jgi:hypothetical protein
MPSTSRPQIVVYPSNQEYKDIQKKADQYGMSMSQYLKFCGLNAEISVRVERENKNE